MAATQPEEELCSVHLTTAQRILMQAWIFFSHFHKGGNKGKEPPSQALSGKTSEQNCSVGNVSSELVAWKAERPGFTAIFS